MPQTRYNNNNNINNNQHYYHHYYTGNSIGSIGVSGVGVGVCNNDNNSQDVE